MGLTFTAFSSCFHLGNKEQWPISKPLKHILGSLGQLCLGYLLILCLSALPALPSFLFLSFFLALLLRPLTPCRPWVWAACLWDRLNLTKLIFRRRRGTTASLLFFSSSWDIADILRWESVSYWEGERGWGGELNTRELTQLRVQMFRRDLAPTL